MRLPKSIAAHYMEKIGNINRVILRKILRRWRFLDLFVE